MASVDELGIAEDDEFAHLLAGDDDIEPSRPSKRVAVMGSSSHRSREAFEAARSRLADEGTELEVLQALSGRTEAQPQRDAKQDAAVAAVLDRAEREGTLQRLDAASTRRLCSQLSKAHQANQVARAKFAGEPARFMESEEQLHDCVRGLQATASDPALLPLLVETGGLETVLAVVGHPNADVSASALELLAECLSAEQEALEELQLRSTTKGGGASKGNQALARACVQLGGCEAVVQRLWELDESGDAEDEEGAARALSVAETLLQAGAGLSGLQVDRRLVRCGLLEFLLRRCLPSAMRSHVPSAPSSSSSSSSVEAASGQGRRVSEDALRGEAASVLALLLQVSPASLQALPRLRAPAEAPAAAHAAGRGWASHRLAQSAAASGLGEEGEQPSSSSATEKEEDSEMCSGVELLVQAVGVYRFKQTNPATLGEREACESLFTALQAAAEEPACRSTLEEVEAVELLCLLARGPGLFARHCAVRALAPLLRGWTAGARLAVRAGVLGAVGPVLLGRARGPTKRVAGAEAASEEAVAAREVLSELVPLLRTGLRKEGEQSQPSREEQADAVRVLAKLLAADGAVVAALVDARRDAAAAVEAAEAKARREAAAVQLEEDDEASVEAVVDLARMEAGLPELLRCDVTLARLCAADARLRARVLDRMVTLRISRSSMERSVQEAVAVLDLGAKEAQRLAQALQS